MLSIGDELEFTSHPNRYVGIVTAIDTYLGEFEITWKDKNLIPPKDRYSLASYLHGDFNKVSSSIYPGDPYTSNLSKCDHIWKRYVGFTDAFEYCEKCDKRKT